MYVCTYVFVHVCDALDQTVTSGFGSTMSLPLMLVLGSNYTLSFYYCTRSGYTINSYLDVTIASTNILHLQLTAAVTSWKLITLNYTAPNATTLSSSYPPAHPYSSLSSSISTVPSALTITHMPFATQDQFILIDSVVMTQSQWIAPSSSSQTATATGDPLLVGTLTAHPCLSFHCLSLIRYLTCTCTRMCMSTR